MNVRPPKDEDLRISDADDIYRIMQKILLRQNKYRRKKEYFWTIGLSIKNDIEFIELISIGNINRTIVDPVEIFSIPVQKKCRRVILCHNHPSGEVSPSDTDIEVTKNLIEAGKIIKIEILDHLIISDTDYYSFFRNGHLSY